jgi:hypothetical protein
VLVTGTGGDMHPNKVTATIEKQAPVEQPPDIVVLKMPINVAQALYDITSRIQTTGKLGSLSFQIFDALSSNGFFCREYPKIVPIGGNIEFVDG